MPPLVPSLASRHSLTGQLVRRTLFSVLFGCGGHERRSRHIPPCGLCLLLKITRGPSGGPPPHHPPTGNRSSRDNTRLPRDDFPGRGQETGTGARPPAGAPPDVSILQDQVQFTT